MKANWQAKNVLLTLFFVELLYPGNANATGRDVIMKTFSVAPEKSASDPVAPEANVKVKIKLRCAGANLRDIANPLARDGLLIPQIVITTPNNTRRVFTLDPASSGGRKVPGWLANSSIIASDQINEKNYVFKCASVEDVNCKAGKGDAYRVINSRYGYLNVNLPIKATDIGNIWINPDNNITLPKVTVNFIQHLARPRFWSEYRGHSGHLTFYQTPPEWDANGREVSITAVMFGEEGYCGGYHSPLVLYFDDERPSYTGIANFDFFGTQGTVYWPEKGSKAYFLAMDRNKNGVIDSNTELFGNVVGEHNNGFEVLAKLDSNKDDLIDVQDPEFGKLLLWKDSTGSGRTLKKDLVPISAMGVKSISLKYQSFIRPYGGRAEERAEAVFKFYPNRKNGKHRSIDEKLSEGKIIDVWFARPTALTSR
jgi:hypothetical protein